MNRRLNQRIDTTVNAMSAIGSLCSGSGMLDEGVRAVLGGDVAWLSERDSASSRLLAYRYPAVPNLGDLTTIDWATVAPVDIITAGYPCQPDSSAGKRFSTDDPRFIFPQIARGISVLRPRLVVLENVEGHFVRGFRTVLGLLAEIGYDAQWTLVRASDIGAPHRRSRLFVLAWPTTDASGGGRERCGGPQPGEPGACRGVRDRSAGRTSGASINWGKYEPAIRRWERLTRPAPAPTETGPKGGQRLAPRFVEWMQGWPDGWVTDVRGLTRNEQLRLCGNGVVPQQAAEAIRQLLAARAETERAA